MKSEHKQATIMTRSNNDVKDCMRIASSFYDDMIPPKIVENERMEQRCRRPVMARRQSSSVTLGEVTPRPSMMMMRWRSSGSNIGNLGRRASLSTRRVRFSEEGNIKVECNYGPLERHEIKRIWYRSKDYEHFERERKKTINKLRENGGDVSTLNADKYCLRGIEEYQCLKGYREKRNKRLEYAEIILREQERQRLFQIDDPNAYQLVGLEYTEYATECAKLAAERDERHARPLKAERFNRRGSMRWVPVDSESDPDEDIPQGGGRRDSLEMTKLKSTMDTFHALMATDPELLTVLSDDGSGDDCDWRDLSGDSLNFDPNAHDEEEC